MLPETIDAVMAVETGGTKRQSMRGHEGGIHLTVAGIAGLRRESCDIALVAIVALEWSPRCRSLVSI